MNHATEATNAVEDRIPAPIPSVPVAVSERARAHEEPVLPVGVMFAHPRSPGELWGAIGWDDERRRNVAADLDRGVRQPNWLPTMRGKAA